MNDYTVLVSQKISEEYLSHAIIFVKKYVNSFNPHNNHVE